MNGPIQRAARSVQLAVMATPTRSLVDALAAARRGADANAAARRAQPTRGASIAAIAAA
jgi:hypothetical protein